MIPGTALIDIKHLSKLLGVSVHTVKTRISKGTIPSPDDRINGVMYWKRETVAGMTAK